MHGETASPLFRSASTNDPKSWRDTSSNEGGTGSTTTGAVLREQPGGKHPRCVHWSAKPYPTYSSSIVMVGSPGAAIPWGSPKERTSWHAFKKRSIGSG